MRRKRYSLEDIDATTRIGDLWDDGVWIGPRHLPFFLRANVVFVAFWFVIVTGICLAVWADAAHLRFAFALPLGLASGAAVTFIFMFGFSRGWVADGD